MSDDAVKDGECEFGLLLAFPDESPSFVHGFEAGGLWERMARGETPIELEVAHSANEEVHRRAAAHWSYDLVWRPMKPPYEVYAKAVFTKAGCGRGARNPNGLRVIK